jgi:hypothetical protein
VVGVYAKDYQVRALDRVFRLFENLVHGALQQGVFPGFGVLIGPGDPRVFKAPQGKSEGAADEPQADDGDFSDFFCALRRRKVIRHIKIFRSFSKKIERFKRTSLKNILCLLAFLSETRFPRQYYFFTAKITEAKIKAPAKVKKVTDCLLDGSHNGSQSKVIFFFISQGRDKSKKKMSSPA